MVKHRCPAGADRRFTRWPGVAQERPYFVLYGNIYALLAAQR
jgi:hypothetical protein